MNFRHTAEAEEEEEVRMEEEEVSVVCKMFDGLTARVLLSDGTKVNADAYFPGDDGFIRARWHSLDETLKLEIPNSRLDREDAVAEIPPLVDAAAATAPATPKSKKGDESENSEEKTPPAVALAEDGPPDGGEDGEESGEAEDGPAEWAWPPDSEGAESGESETVLGDEEQVRRPTLNSHTAFHTFILSQS